MGFLDDLFGGGQQEGYQDLIDQLQRGQQSQQQYTQQGIGYLDPYRQFGQQAGGDLQSMFAQMRDPSAYINNILSGYQQSPAEQFAQKQALEAITNQAQSQGLGGSSAAQMQAGQTAANIAGQNQNQYLQNVLGVNQNRMGGLQNLVGAGAGAAGQSAAMMGNLGQSMMSSYGDIGNAMYGQDVSRGTALSNLLGTIGGIGVGAATGGLFGTGVEGFMSKLLGGLGGAGGAGGSGAVGGPGIVSPYSQWGQGSQNYLNSLFS